MSIERFLVGKNLEHNTKIYRYMSLKQFMHFIENDKTYFTRISSGDDTWEAPTIKLPTQFENGQVEMPQYSAGMDLFAQCWTSKEESDAMWRIYSTSKDGIRIGTTVKKFELLQGTNHYVIERIFYYKELMEGLEYCQKPSSIMKIIRDGLIKRDAFSHEEEVRIITLNQPRFLDNILDDKENYLELDLNAKDFIEEITVDPRAEEYYVETIKSYCRRVGLEVIPKKSDLYKDNIYETTNIVQRFISVKDK